MKKSHEYKFVNKRIWNDFCAHFKSGTTAASYKADITEIQEYFQKDFLQIREKEVEKYFLHLQEKVKDRRIQPSTAAKKMRELHSFADYICENRKKYGIEGSYTDVYYPWLKYTAKQEKYTRSIPVEDMDRLLAAAEADLRTYTILVLLYRVGLSSTEIIGLKAEDIAAYDNGVYIKPKGRQDACFMPEDVFVILEKYLQSDKNYFPKTQSALEGSDTEKEESEYIFLNDRGKKLNPMYISRLLKKYCKEAGVPSYSAQAIRNTCGVTMFAYGGKPEQVAHQMGITQIQVHRYKNMSYRENLQREAASLIKLKVEPPGFPAGF